MQILNSVILSKNGTIKFWQDLNVVVRCMHYVRRERVDNIARIEFRSLLRNHQIAKFSVDICMHLLL